MDRYGTRCSGIEQLSIGVAGERDSKRLLVTVRLNLQSIMKGAAQYSSHCSNDCSNGHEHQRTATHENRPITRGSERLRTPMNTLHGIRNERVGGSSPFFGSGFRQKGRQSGGLFASLAPVPCGFRKPSPRICTYCSSHCSNAVERLRTPMNRSGFCTGS